VEKPIRVIWIGLKEAHIRERAKREAG